MAARSRLGTRHGRDATLSPLRAMSQEMVEFEFHIGWSPSVPPDGALEAAP
jgi:hypothetical protein